MREGLSRRRDNLSLDNDDLTLLGISALHVDIIKEGAGRKALGMIR